MGRVIVDAATSLDGFHTDASGESVFPAEEMQRAGMVERLAASCGAVVMSLRSLESSGDRDRYSGDHGPDLPIFVVAEIPPAQRRPPHFHFVATFADAFAEAKAVAGDRAVLVIGETSAVDAALRSGEADEIWLRVVSRTLGHGELLFTDLTPGQDYFVSELETTSSTVHMHLERRQGAAAQVGQASRSPRRCSAIVTRKIASPPSDSAAPIQPVEVSP